MAGEGEFGITAKDVAFSERGELLITNPELIRRISAATSQIAKVAAADTNYVGCGGNAYQCGKGLADFGEMINTARGMK